MAGVILSVVFGTFRLRPGLTLRSDHSRRTREAVSAMSMRFIKLTALLATLAVAAATPASAAKKHKHAKHRAAVAAATTHGQYRGADKFPAGPLYYNGGVYLGDDPDPNIRFQLWRDLGARFGGDP
jgi:hypothetical protein